MAYRLEPSDPLDEELSRVAGECLDDALGRLEGLGTESGSIESAVHEVRKRCKELRGLARLVRPALGEGYSTLNAEVRDAAKELSSIRDAHAVLGTIEDLQESLGAEQAEVLDPIRAHQTVQIEIATHDLHADDPRITQAAARLRLARELVGAWPLIDDVTILEEGLARTYRRGRKALKRARKHPSDESVHDWRKRVKYLWYHARLLEPADPDGLGPLVADLDELSDLLGDDHDLAVLVEQLEAGRGADALAGADIDGAIDLARERQAELRSAALDLGRRVYADAPPAFVERLIAPWRAVGRGGTVERERKFLVADMPDLPDAGSRIAQGYLALDGSVSVRVRDAKGKGRTLTIKGGAGSSRTELEWQIGQERFDAAWALTEGRRIDKTRYVVPVAGGGVDVEAEVDIFAGDLTGLVVVEVEFDSDDAMAAFDPPAWFGLEVTDDLRYTNASLAVDGLQPGMGPEPA